MEELAAAASIPVINALTDEHHPCQALADLMTIEEEFGTLAGCTLAFVGDGDNVCHSLIEAAALGGFELRSAAPPATSRTADIVAEARRQGRTTGGAIELTTIRSRPVDGADAVYTDVWASMGQEAEQDARRPDFASYRVDERAHGTRRARGDLPALPARASRRGGHRRGDRRPGSRVWHQAANRLHTETALSTRSSSTA